MTTTLISGPDVWMESEAVRQLDAVAALEGCIRAAGMPDLHPGRGFPIGAAVACRGVVHPHLVGGDAGCGARVVVTNVDKVSPDKLERRLRAAFESDPFEGVDPAALFEAAWHGGPRALATLDGLPDDLQRLASREPLAADDGLPVSGDPAAFRLGFEASLGTIGGGNHFAEVSRAARPVDTAEAATLGLSRNSIVALVHSGSRGLGTALAEAWGMRALRGADADQQRYLGELAGACRYARTNRVVLSYRVLSALAALRDHAILGAFDVTHNDVRSETVEGEEAFVHRKGAAPAPEGKLAVVLGSRGAPSWIVKGTGNAHGLASVAHGAGRKMTRSEAVAKLKDKYRRKELRGGVSSGHVLCDDNALLYEEHPDAYKAIEPVIAALESHDQATRVAALDPVITVKI